MGNPKETLRKPLDNLFSFCTIHPSCWTLMMIHCISLLIVVILYGMTGVQCLMMEDILFPPRSLDYVEHQVVSVNTQSPTITLTVLYENDTREKKE